MTCEEAMRIHKELREMVGDHPYPIPGAHERLGRIRLEFEQLPRVTSYFREKVFGAIGWVDIWCSDRKWQQWGEDPTRLRGLVLNSLFLMESIIKQELADAGGSTLKASH